MFPSFKQGLAPILNNLFRSGAVSLGEEYTTLVNISREFRMEIQQQMEILFRSIWTVFYTLILILIGA